MYSVYILYSESADKYYIGHTENIDKRIHQHNNPPVLNLIKVNSF